MRLAALRVATSGGGSAGLSCAASCQSRRGGKRSYSSFVRVRQGRNSTTGLDSPLVWNASWIEQILQQNESVVFYPEALQLDSDTWSPNSQQATSVSRMLFPEDNPLSKLALSFARRFGLPTTTHVYFSGPGGSALEPHTDMYDVFVIQLFGSKTWTVCVPNPDSDIAGYYTAAELCQLQENRLRRQNGCTKYSAIHNSRLFSCKQVVLFPGYGFYIPKGVIHFAQVAQRSLEASVHVCRPPQHWAAMDRFAASGNVCSHFGRESDC